MKIFRIKFILNFVLFILLSGCTGITQLDFTSWGRAIWQRPDDVIQSLDIPGGSRVVDLGAGEGYFVPYLSRAVGEDGIVYAVEVDAKLVEAMKNQFGETSNVEVVLGEYQDPRLPDGQIDLILIVNTYHHIENREVYFQNLLRDLSPDGRVVVIEPDEELSGILSLFVEEGHASRAADVEREMNTAGYRLLQTLDLLPVQIFMIYGRNE